MNCEWETPSNLFKELDDEFHFTIDVCATKANAKCRRFITKEQDALTRPWRGVCWMNPPYDRTIGRWIEKAEDEAYFNGATVVCLIPSRTDTAWWHEYVTRREVRFIRGRLTFSGRGRARFPSAVVIFRGRS